MKKNRTMRLAALLLVLTLITSCFVGGTFAKYITTNETDDSARVAHWGFKSAGEIEFELFDLASPDDENSVKSSNDDKVIAPGTTNTVKFTLVNNDDDVTPEVAYKITVNTSGSTPKELSTELEAALVFELDDQKNLTWTGLLAAINDLSGSEDGSGVKEYKAGEEIPAMANGEEHTITWTWAWAEDETSNTRDNTLGSKDIDNLEELSLSIVVTAEQLDTYTATP